jgi:hypothetical protein
MKRVSKHFDRDNRILLCQAVPEQGSNSQGLNQQEPATQIDREQSIKSNERNNPGSPNSVRTREDVDQEASGGVYDEM